MTIDERLERFISRIDTPEVDAVIDVTALRITLAEIFQLIARDQRYACAEAITTLEGKPTYGYRDADEAHRAIMNAEIK